MAADEKWYFTKDQLQNTPSRKCGFDADKELSYRQQAANFIQDMGQKLQVSQLCINTAIVYMHRFYMFHSFTHFPWNTIAAASFFLAAKVEEQPRKLEHVIRVANICLHREPGVAFDAKSEQYAAQSQELVFNENVLLQTLGFDVAIDHPHTHVVRCCHLVRASKDLAQTSYFMASNSLHLTTMCLQYKPTVVACFCIHLACKWSNWQIPKSNEGKDWFFYVDKSVTSELLEQLTAEFLVIFDKCPSRLKRKILSIQTINPHGNLSEQSHTSNSNSPFDTEPRKTQPGKDEPSFHSRMTHEPKQPLTMGDDPYKKPARPHDSSQQRVEYRDYREKKERERLEREKQAHHAKAGAPPPGKHLPPGAPGKPPHGHHRPPMGPNDPKLKMHHRPSGSREMQEGRDPNAHVARDANREGVPVSVPRDYNRESNGRDSRDLAPHRDRESSHRDVNNREVHRDPNKEVHRDPNKEVQKHRPDMKIHSELHKIDSVDKRFDPNRQKLDPKLMPKHNDPNRHKYQKRPETVPSVSENKKPVPPQSAQDKNSYVKTISTSQRHKSPFTDTPKSVPENQNPPSYQKNETRNGNHTNNTNTPVEKPTWPENMISDEPGLVTPPKQRQPSLFSPEKTTPPKKTWPKSPPNSGKKVTDTSPAFRANPSAKPTPGSTRRHRNSSSSSEPELRPVVKKLDQISGFENIIRDSKMGIKLPKVPDIIQPICDRSSEKTAETSISKELKPPDIIKPFNSSTDTSLSQPLVNGIETNPTLISNLLKEVPAPAITHLPVIETKSPEKSSLAPQTHETEAQVVNNTPAVASNVETSVEKHKGEHHHKSEKKKKKDKHKHKDKDKSKDEKKKKHKDKDKEKHKSKTIRPEETPIKLTIPKEKIQPITPEPTGLKVKISKDRLQPENIEKPGSLKIKISKDAIQYSVTEGAKKRERDKTSPTPGPPTKIAKTTYRNQDTRQNGRNSYSKVSYNNNNRGRFSNNMPQRMPPPQVFQQNQPPPQFYVPNYPPPNVVAQPAYMYPTEPMYQYYGYQMYPPPDMYVQPQAPPTNAPPPLPDGPPPNIPPPPPPE